MLVRQRGGEGCNHLAWQLGRLISSEVQLLEVDLCREQPELAKQLKEVTEKNEDNLAVIRGPRQGGAGPIATQWNLSATPIVADESRYAWPLNLPASYAFVRWVC